ncbi:hypothetical protein [Fuerstiella marisgermanici]|uniref:Uncharacterized protein n=1 Tax=Fuerstiella marisgermanici TaxID=1891926 RepID=A0A1P8WMI5_9PLAN|nr:hypothetical protein [Fuerstiella marisgermanici]APZ95283.1 hypothetical protein Fuma_04939 [Fuerstiella marisgermanici]
MDWSNAFERRLGNDIMTPRFHVFLCGLLAAIQTVAASEPVKLSTIQDEDINESSGIAASYTHHNAIWVHNDSGDKPQLYLVGTNGETQAVVNLRDADAVDWEDMCSFSVDGKSWLLIGDIGDNGQVRGKKKNAGCCLYLVNEPKVPQANGRPKISWSIAAKIDFDYEDGRWDCEGLAVDVERKEILVLTKGLPGKSGLFVMPLDLQTRHQHRTAQRIASPYIPFVTALDISPSGRTMVVGTMLNGLAVTRKADESWKDAFTRLGTAFNLPPRKQGETICFDRSGRWLFLTSEGKNQPLWRMPVPE